MSGQLNIDSNSCYAHDTYAHDNLIILIQKHKQGWWINKKIDYFKYPLPPNQIQAFIA